MSTKFRNAGAAIMNVPNTSPLTAARPIAEGDPLASVREMATLVRARRRQRLTFDGTQGEVVYVLRSGMLGVEAYPPGKPRQLLSLVYPGDIIRRSLLPELPGITLAALCPSEIWRFPLHTFDALPAANPPMVWHFLKKLGAQNARATLHASIIGGLSGDERFASLLIELGLRLQNPASVARTFEMPLSRADVADHLALNPDTLSRINSRFKARGLLAASSGQVSLPDWSALCAASPVCSTLHALHSRNAA